MPPPNPDVQVQDSGFVPEIDALWRGVFHLCSGFNSRLRGIDALSFDWARTGSCLLYVLDREAGSGLQKRSLSQGVFYSFRYPGTSRRRHRAKPIKEFTIFSDNIFVKVPARLCTSS